MVDEVAFRHLREEFNRLPCVFERALLAHHAVCDHAVRQQIAEREAVKCSKPAMERVCQRLSSLLRDKSAFALGLTGTQRILPHAMMMKIQCGGLDGLKTLLDADTATPDVPRLADLAQARFGDISELPFSQIVQSVAAWKLRRRHSGAPK